MKQKAKQKGRSAQPSPAKGRQEPDQKRRLMLGLIIGLLGFLLYSNTFSNGYVLDDFSAIKENNIVRQGIHAIPEIFRTSYRQGYLSVKDGLYRPLSLASYAIEWNYFPDKPGVAHFVNVILYALTGFLLFILLCKLFGPPQSSRREGAARDISSPSGRQGGATDIIAFIASLLFIAHPLHAEVVANIKSRDEILCFLFVIISFISTFKFLDTGKIKFLIGGLVSYFLSLLSKETSITFLALLPLSLHFFSSAGLKRNLSLTAFFIATAAIYLFIRHSVLQGAMADDGVSMADNVIAGAKTFGDRMGTAFYILGLYIKMLVFPHPMSYDYSFSHLQVVGMGNLISILALLTYAAAGAYAVWILFGSFRKEQEIRQKELRTDILCFGILFFLITIFLFSNLALKIGTSMGDRLMYFPSLGFCIAIAVLLTRSLKINNIDPSKISSFFQTGFLPVLLIVLLFGAKTYSRNFDWKDNYTLYSHDVLLVPNSVKAHYYLGLELVKNVADAEQDAAKKEKIYKDGIHELERAVEIMPSFGSAYTQMGVAYFRLKNYEKAIENYNKAEKLKPSDAITLNNIGTVYFQWGKYAEASEYFKKALQIDPRFIDAYMNLGSVYGTLHDFNNAIQSFQNAVHYAPDNARAYYYIGMTYENMGDKTNAAKYYEMAKQRDPKLAKTR